MKRCPLCGKGTLVSSAAVLETLNNVRVEVSALSCDTCSYVVVKDAGTARAKKMDNKTKKV